MYTFSSVLYPFLKYLVLTVRSLHINPKPSLYWEDDAHRYCYASCFSSHMSTVSLWRDGPNTHSSTSDYCIRLWAGSCSVCAPKSETVCKVKFERKTTSKNFLRNIK